MVDGDLVGGCHGLLGFWSVLQLIEGRATDEFVVDLDTSQDQTDAFITHET